MYESHFGITGPPFQLTPDPSFYFDSKGHHRALTEVRRGLAEGAGFIVVSGEIGAGKTTLVRTLLAELDPAGVAVAQVLSTQLKADELLRAILFAFGMPGDSAPNASLIPTIRQFLASLRTGGRRAILIIDEAQNLHQDAFEQLVALADSVSGEQAPFQICLVGQPELRAMIDSHELLQLRQRVSVSCHLGPIGQSETRDYIEHRLSKVGWNGHPGFDPAAFDEVFRWTQGVPRRINLLCNRLMLSCFLASHTRIDAAAVVQTARDLRVEIGEPGAAMAPSAAVVAPAAATLRDSTARGAATPAPADQPERKTIGQQPGANKPAEEPDPILCVVGGHSDHVAMAPVLHALAARADLPKAKLVRAYRNNALELNQELFSGLDVSIDLVNLDVVGGTYAEQAAELVKKFVSVIDRYRPAAVIVIDGSEAALACSLVARKRKVSIIHIGTGLPTRGGSAAAEMTRKLTDELADVLYTCDAEAAATLAAAGVPADRIHCVGTLLVDSLQLALRSLLNAPGRGVPRGVPKQLLVDRNGYAFVVLKERINVGDTRNFREVVSLLKDVSRDVPLIWLMHSNVDEQLKKLRLDSLIARERIACVPAQGYLPYVELLRNATCVLTDSWSLQEEAAALGIPCLMIGLHPQRADSAAIGAMVSVGNNRALATRAVWECIFNGGMRWRLPPAWDGHAALRIAEHLAAWLPRPRSGLHAHAQRADRP